MEKSCTIVCPYCKNKQTAFLETGPVSNIKQIECIVKTCKELITGEMLETAFAETQFFRPGMNNKY